MASAATTGRPEAMASMVAIDCSSAIEGMANTVALSYTFGNSSSEI